jgi:hypothetical protein
LSSVLIVFKIRDVIRETEDWDREGVNKGDPNE